MPSGERRGPGAIDQAPDVNAELSSVNAVFTLSLILTQASSPVQLIRLVTTAIPSIARCQRVLAWHPFSAGDYYERAPDGIGDALAALTEPGLLDLGDSSSCWAFPVNSRRAGEPVFLVVIGDEALTAEESFLLSVLAQLCGTVIAKLELIAAERMNAGRVAELNAELASTVTTLTKIMEIHHRLNAIVTSAGEAGIAETLHELTSFGVVISDEKGHARATAGHGPDAGLSPQTPETAEPAGDRRELLRRLRTAPRPFYHRQAWLALARPRAGLEGVIALIDPAGTAGETDLAALEYAATVLSVELARVHSVAQAQLRGLADRDRDIAQARAAALSASEARQRAVLEAALDAVVSADQLGRITYVNSAFEQIFGYRAAEVIGRELGEVIVPPSLREAHRQGFARHLATGERRILDQRLELTAMRADGSVFPAEVTVTRTGPAGEPAFTGYIRDITERQRAEQDLMASRARLVAASDTARRRVTRDLHDGAQQRFVTTLINLQLAEQKWDSAPEQARELVSRALRDARYGLQDLRELVAGIHPELLTQRGLAAAIGALAARLPFPVELDVPARRLPAAVEASVYFFCAEALTNVVRHARATSAAVRVDVSADRCAVEVRDDGVGGARPRSEDSGLTGLRDRIGALRGTVEIDSPAAGGTLLRASIPLGPASGPDERTFIP
ncbi:MAG TPA: PAS domain S-box protein [Streptosporangiaceae bacterium]|jgi:PAS domain S-box-containing protein